MDSLDDRFLTQTSKVHRKKLGQFLTPRPIAKLMAEWIVAHAPASVMDPAVGTGILLDEVARMDPSISLSGYDVDAQALEVARQRLNVDLYLRSFLTLESPQFDAVIANPPYIRHHDFQLDDRISDRLSDVVGEKLSGLTNIYALFLVASLAALKPGGVAAFLLPAEFAHANFSGPVKQFMLSRGYLKRVIYFDPSKLAFDDNLSTGCVLFFRNDGVTDAVEMCFADPEQRHRTWDTISTDPGSIATRVARPLLAASRKWNHLVRSEGAGPLPGYVPLSALASSKRGIATGANAFFLLDRDTVTRKGLCDVTVGCVGKAKDVQGYLFAQQHFEALQSRGAPTRLVVLDEAKTPAQRSFVSDGVARGIDRMYLTSRRNPWYSMERQRVAPIWAAVFGRGAMRFVSNDARVHHLTAFHGLYPLSEDGRFVHALVACLNSQIVQECARRHQRAYGGGLQKFEPRDLLDIPVPDLRQTPETLLDDLAECLPLLSPGKRSPALEALVKAAAQQAVKSCTKLGRQSAK